MADPGPVKGGIIEPHLFDIRVIRRMVFSDNEQPIALHFHFGSSKQRRAKPVLVGAGDGIQPRRAQDVPGGEGPSVIIGVFLMPERFREE